MAARGDGSFVIRNACDPRRGIDEARRRQIHLLHRRLRIKRSGGGIVGVDRSGLALDFQAPIRRQLCRHLEGEGGGKGKVSYLDISLVVYSWLLLRALP